MKQQISKLLKVATLFIALAIVSILISDWLIEQSSRGKIYNSTKEIKSNKVGLLLGTGKFLNNGNINLYYTYRIQAASELFKAQKIEYILVSGDNSKTNYDEPTSIKKDLIAKGIPANKIFLDYAGFRTLDSIIRSKKIFGQNSLTIISQEFHNKRALYIAKKNNIKAIAYNAKDVNKRYGLKTQLRERLARVKMVIDLLFGKKPKFLGKKIEIK